MSKKIKPNQPNKETIEQEKYCVCGHSNLFHGASPSKCHADKYCLCEKFILNWYSGGKGMA